MSKLKLLGALLLTIGGTTQLLYAEQPSIMANSPYCTTKINVLRSCKRCVW